MHRPVYRSSSRGTAIGIESIGQFTPDDELLCHANGTLV
jgi:hypothetical protein